MVRLEPRSVPCLLDHKVWCPYFQALLLAPAVISQMSWLKPLHPLGQFPSGLSIIHMNCVYGMKTDPLMNSEDQGEEQGHCLLRLAFCFNELMQPKSALVLQGYTFILYHLGHILRIVQCSFLMYAADFQKLTSVIYSTFPSLIKPQFSGM